MFLSHEMYLFILSNKKLISFSISLSDNMDNFKFAKNFMNRDGFDYWFLFLFKSCMIKSKIYFVTFLDCIF